MPNLTEKRHVAFLNKHTTQPVSTDNISELQTHSSHLNSIASRLQFGTGQLMINGVQDNGNLQQLKCEDGRLRITTQTPSYENETGVATGLTIYGSNNGTAIDMNGYRNVVIKVRSTATTGLSPLQNLRLYYSMDNADFIMGEVIEQNELPGVLTNYQGFIRIENVGFRYIRLLAVGVKASPTAYYINYSRYN